MGVSNACYNNIPWSKRPTLVIVFGEKKLNFAFKTNRSIALLGKMVVSDTYMELNILSKDVKAKPIANIDFIFT